MRIGGESWDTLVPAPKNFQNSEFVGICALCWALFLGNIIMGLVGEVLRFVKVNDFEVYCGDLS